MKIPRKLTKSKLGRALAGAVVGYKGYKELALVARHFDNYLEPVVVNNEEHLNEVFALRHAVYCKELKLLPESANGLERDKFDQFSRFCMIRHKASGQFVGCVRVVSPENETHKLPLEDFCKQAYAGSDIRPDDFAREEICEFSRLAVRAEFRRRQGDQIHGAATGSFDEKTYSTEEMRCFPFISLGLYLSGITLGVETGKKHGFVMTEPRLAKSMRRVGIKFVQIGEPVNYHGLRAPYYCNEDILKSGLAKPIRDLMEIIRHRVREQLGDNELSDARRAGN